MFVIVATAGACRQNRKGKRAQILSVSMPQEIKKVRFVKLRKSKCNETTMLPLLGIPSIQCCLSTTVDDINVYYFFHDYLVLLPVFRSVTHSLLRSLSFLSRTRDSITRYVDRSIAVRFFVCLRTFSVMTAPAQRLGLAFLGSGPEGDEVL